AEASIAARRPAPPAPITSTSYSKRGKSVTSEDPPVGPDAHRAEPHVQVRERDREQARPRPAPVDPVEATDAGVGLAAHRPAGEDVEPSAHQVPQRMAAERVAAEEEDVRREHQRPDPEAERGHAGPGVGEPESQPDVVEQEDEKEQHEIEKVAMDVLHDERERALAAVDLAR